MISKKQQRLNCLVSLIFVRNYLIYPLENRPRGLDQLGAEIIFGERWKSSTLLRIIINVLLPIIMCLLDVYLLIKKRPPFILCIFVDKIFNNHINS